MVIIWAPLFAEQALVEYFSFRAAVLKLFTENHAPVQRFKDLKRLLAFSPAKVAGVGLAKQWHDSDFLIATLFNLPHSLNAVEM